MPSKIYCPNVNCAEPILYELTKPVVCPFCGNQLSSISIASQKPKTPIKKTIIEEDVEEIDDEYEEIEPPKTHKLFGQTNKKSKRVRREEPENDIDLGELNINALELVVPIDTKKDKGVKFEDLAFQKKTGFERVKPKKVNKKKELEIFRTEAGAGGRKDISIEAPEDRD